MTAARTPRSDPDPRARRALVRCALPILIGGAAWLLAPPGTRLFAHLFWLSLVAAPLGTVAAGLRLPALASLGFLLWTLPLLGSPQSMETPALGLLACGGLLGLGWGIGALRPERALRSAGLLLLALALLAGLATGAGLLHRPLPPAVAARLFDLSPLTLVLECAGLDWMRHPLVYESLDSASIGPELRTAWRGILAAPLVFVVGCALAVAGNKLRRGARSE